MALVTTEFLEAKPYTYHLKKRGDKMDSREI